MCATQHGACRAAARPNQDAPSPPPPLPPPAPDLVALYSQLESARALAAAGDFEACRAGYAAAEAGLRAVAAAATPAPGAAQSWAGFLAQLAEERELVAAWEAECAELEAWTAEQVREGRPVMAAAGCWVGRVHPRGLGAVGWPSRAHMASFNSPDSAPCCPAQPSPAQSGRATGGGAAPGCAGQAGAHAFTVDPRSFRCEELPPRPQQQATPPAGAGQRDPDVWSPADPLAPGSGAATPPLGSAHRGRGGTWRDKGEAYERVRRESTTPGGSGGLAGGQGG